MTPDEVRQTIQKMIDGMRGDGHLQTTYVEAREREMVYLDESMDSGDWNVAQTTPDIPFVIGDAPVVTWERNDNSGNR